MKKLIQAFALLLSLSSPTFAQTSGFEVLPSAETRSQPERVEVIEYFWFGCPHCFRFEPTINEWAANKPDFVDFVREAPPLNAQWKPHSQAFYASQVLGKTDEFFEPFFNAIHVEKKRLNSPKSIAKFAATLGFDEKEFLKTMKSFAVDAKIRKAIELARADQINSVQRVIQIINELAEKEHAG